MEAENPRKLKRKKSAKGCLDRSSNLPRQMACSLLRSIKIKFPKGFWQKRQKTDSMPENTTI
jgi:hypothetical protein